jgi:NAD(P)-dependent dehydrogenase (short-subunit alcohol dehydrogenase family)
MRPAAAAGGGGSSTEGRVALVTGGATGRGAAVVRALVARGYAVAIHCHSSLAAARSLADAVAATGGAALAVTADLREEPAVRALVHRVADTFGRIDALVTCAGIDRPTSFEDLSPADLRGHFDISCIGGLLLAQEVAAVMARQETGGAIVMTMASTAVPPAPGHVPAFTATAAIAGLVRSLAVEFAAECPGVRINGLVIAGPPAVDPPEGVAEAAVRLIEGPAAQGDCLTVHALQG